MWKELFDGMDLSGLSIATMFFFLAIFVGVVIWALSPRRSAEFDHLSRLPLDDGEVNR